MSLTIDPNTTPALAPPAGSTSNFDNPFSIHAAEVVVSSVSLALCTAFVTAHVYARAAVAKTFGLTDVALLISWASLAAYVAIAIYDGQFGQGRHQWDVTLADFLKLQQPLNVLEILYSPVVFGAKYTVLRQIETIFFDHRRRHLAYRVIRGLIWANLLFYAAIMFVFIFACVPREKIWNPTLDGKCIDTTAAIVGSGTINLVSDLTILVVPVSAVLNLNIPFKKKLGVAAVFAVGILANVASAVKLYYSVKLTQTQDVTFAISHVGFASFAEITSIFLVACVPQFPRLIQHFRHQNRSQTGYPSTAMGRKKNSNYIQVEEGIQMPESRSKTRDDGAI
ncbi:hypothetical protein GGR57DRAFT_486984 [Xylariaceae sp. FL1272]|nr:hypothetical protein GGR57DRAFT_486984 [Xylariaceae sp. FL1272]